MKVKIVQNYNYDNNNKIKKVNNIKIFKINKIEYFFYFDLSFNSDLLMVFDD